MVDLKTLVEAHQFEALLRQDVDQRICVTELLRCRNAEGRPFYAYIRIKPSQYMDYKTKLGQGTGIDPNDYQILEYGWGEEPPENVRRIMEERHGVDHDFENKIRELLEKKKRKKMPVINSISSFIRSLKTMALAV